MYNLNTLDPFIVERILKFQDEEKMMKLKNSVPDPTDDLIPSYPKLKRKPRSIDIFAECVGSSQGLHNAEAAEVF